MLSLPVSAGANNRRHLVGEDSAKQRQIARMVMPRAKPIPDCGLAFGQAVEFTHRRRLRRADAERQEAAPPGHSLADMPSPRLAN